MSGGREVRVDPAQLRDFATTIGDVATRLPRQSATLAGVNRAGLGRMSLAGAVEAMMGRVVVEDQGIGQDLNALADSTRTSAAHYENNESHAMVKQP